MRTRRRVKWTLLLVLLGTAACGPSSTNAGEACDTATPCAGGYACNPATARCEAIICDPGEATGCEGDLLKRCNSLGTASVAESCLTGHVCRNSLCIAATVCDPGTTYCANSTTLARCNADGQSFTTVKSCDVAVDSLCAQLAPTLPPDCVSACDRARVERSNFGCEFFAVDLLNGAYSGLPTDQYAIVISNVSASRPAHVIVDVAGGTVLFTKDVAPLAVETFLPPRQQRTTTNLEAVAFRVQSDIPVVAFQINPLNNVGVYSNDGTILLPTSSLDTDYLVMTRASSLADLPGYFTVVAVEDGTEVRFTPPASGSGTQAAPGSPPPIPGIAPGVAYDVPRPMNRYEVLQVLANITTLDNTTDLTGTVIHASKPVMVFGGSAGAEVPAGIKYADHIEHVMFPVSAWGKTYAVARAPRFQESDYVRILAYKDGTHVTLTPGPSGNPVDEMDILAGQAIEVASTIDFMIEATEAIMVGQFLAGQQATGLPQQGGDPAFFLIGPVEQFRTSYVFLTPDGFRHNRLVLVARQGATNIQVDGRELPLGAFTTIAPLPDKTYEVFRLELDPGTHLVQSAGDHPVGIVIYGYDEAVSYAYTGGLSLAQITVME